MIDHESYENFIELLEEAVVFLFKGLEPAIVNNHKGYLEKWAKYLESPVFLPEYEACCQQE